MITRMVYNVHANQIILHPQKLKKFLEHNIKIEQKMSFLVVEKNA